MKYIIRKKNDGQVIKILVFSIKESYLMMTVKKLIYFQVVLVINVINDIILQFNLVYMLFNEYN